VSCRHLLFRLTNNQVELYRDCDTRTYRIFVDGSCVDLTTAEFMQFADAVVDARAKHESFYNEDGELVAE
jgi:hypothetical protein